MINVVDQESKDLCPRPPAPVFVRDATGLIRSLNFRDQFLLSQLGVSVLNGYVYSAVFCPYFFPSANLSWVFIIGTIPAFALAIVYSKMSVAMPRSGGDYVWSSRIMGPLYGLVGIVFLVLACMLVGVFTVYNNQTIAVAQFLIILGLVTKNTGYISMAGSLTTPQIGFWCSIAALTCMGALAVASIRIVRYALLVTMIYFFIATTAFTIMLYAIDPMSIPAQFNNVMNALGSTATYSGVIKQAASSGFDMSGFNLQNTLLAGIPWGFFVYQGWNYGTYLTGETRNVKSSVPRALYISTGMTLVWLVIMAQGEYRSFGTAFVNAASYVAAASPSAMPTLPSATFLVSMANPGVGMAASLAIALGGYVGCASYPSLRLDEQSSLPPLIACCLQNWQR